MLRLSSIVRDAKDLRLSQLVNTGDDPNVEWVHVSELTDPTRWLTGDELLLTTGLDLFHSQFNFVGYCERLSTAGVAALGLSTGASLPHLSPPAQLVEAARQVRLPLLHVPEGTPLQSVVRWVSHTLNEEQTLPLRQALVAQRRLTEAVTRSNGVSAVVEVVASMKGFSVQVCDSSLRTLAEAGPQAEDLIHTYSSEIRSHLPEGLRWSIVSEHDSSTGRRTTFIAPLGTNDELRGVIVAEKQESATANDRAFMSIVYSQLSVLLQLRHAAGSSLREARSRAVSDLLENPLGRVDAIVRLAQAGVRAHRVLMISTSRDLTDSEREILSANLTVSTTDVLFANYRQHLNIMLVDPDDSIRDAIEIGFSQFNELHAGIGLRVPLESIRSSSRQAERALQIATNRNIPVMSLSDQGGFRTLLALGSNAEKEAFVGKLIEPLVEHDPDGDLQLIASLREYLRQSDNMVKAARNLGMHRHTLRSRLELIASLTSRQLTEPDDRFELWLAIELFDLNHKYLP